MERQLSFLDVPIHYWDESNPVNMRLRSQMRERYLRISDRVEAHRKSREKGCECTSTQTANTG